ncbi:MAG: hypothetical protein J0H75_05810, partial [Rhizobiales bacterium]|nr:hypothetical protein [Hyphomicrobiales bacterium]
MALFDRGIAGFENETDHLRLVHVFEFRPRHLYGRSGDELAAAFLSPPGKQLCLRRIEQLVPCRWREIEEVRPFLGVIALLLATRCLRLCRFGETFVLLLRRHALKLDGALAQHRHLAQRIANAASLIHPRQEPGRKRRQRVGMRKQLGPLAQHCQSLRNHPTQERRGSEIHRNWKRRFPFDAVAVSNGQSGRLAIADDDIVVFGTENHDN